MEGLVLEEIIIAVHDDLEPWASLSAGFNDNKDFVVELNFDSMGDGSDYRQHKKRIVIGQKGIDKLLDRLHTRLTKLPEKFAEEFGDGSGSHNAIECWDEREVFYIYHEILSYLSNLDIHYKIERSYPSGD